MLLQHPMEEETLPLYESEQYYPVKIGQVFADRYEVVGKLGYGAHSTNWLCRDLRSHSFRTVKVSTCLGHQPQASAFRERAVYRHIAAVTAQSTHPGKHLIRTLHDDFSLDGTSGSHHALVFRPMYATMRERARQHPHGVLRLADAKRLIRGLLLALAFLHDEAGVVHTDLKTDNLMLTIEDGGMLNDFVHQEETSPSTPMLCDFGDARIGLVQQPCRHVQPVVFRAPEVVFDMEWGTGADMWNVWELIQGERLFRDVVDISGGGHNAFRHSARMVALLGNPPESFLHRSMATAQCFDTDG
ncbi:Serine/threonine-protein kinase SRPK [Ceratocystis platani]|uniref:non-specific serine/threonine protein kinase n=1 Tax=Ceratocystis fimbriata f. sp. platani TaxID=88771 RepID=A0A0F8B5W6_CERFI|nr:Serine/threonine-protein kinase SRPK [Ceratocystis platani]